MTGRLCALFLLLPVISTPLAAEEMLGQMPMARIQIYAGPLARDYLGCLSCDRNEVSAVLNPYGPYGWDNAYAAHSHFAQYRHPKGRYSACDPYAAEPPILVDSSGRTYGKLSISTLRPDSICGPHGSPGVCVPLTEMCRHAAMDP